jgi:hypothetical protein
MCSGFAAKQLTNPNATDAVGGYTQHYNIFASPDLGEASKKK